MNSEVCVLCNKSLEGLETVNVKEKGVKTMYECSIKRCDGLWAQLEGVHQLVVHVSCRKSYINENMIRSYLKKKKLSETHVEVSTEVFDFESRCLFCNKDASKYYMAKEAKKPLKLQNFVRSVKLVQTKNSIENYAVKRGDSFSETILQRIKSVDLVDVKAKYHRMCYDKFRLSDELTNEGIRKRGRPESETTSRAMDDIFSFVRSHGGECQFTLNDLKNVISGECPDNRTITNKIKEKYGEQVTIAYLKGKPTTFCFGSICCNCIGDRKEKSRVVRKAASTVRGKINVMVQSSTSTQQDTVLQIDPDHQSNSSLISEPEDSSVYNLTESYVDNDDHSNSSLISEPDDSNVSNLTESNADKENSSAVHNCESCFKEITAVRYVCLVCSQQEWCEGCEARGGQHGDHYVLRVPMRRPLAEVKQVQSAVREALTSLPVCKNTSGVKVAQKTKTRNKTKKSNKPRNNLSDSGIDQKETMNIPIETENEPTNSGVPVPFKEEVEDNNEEKEVKVEFVVKEEMDPLEEDTASASLQNIEKRETTHYSQDIPSSQPATPSQMKLTSQVFQAPAPSQNSPVFLVAMSSPETPLYYVASQSHDALPCQVGSLSQVATLAQVVRPYQISPATEYIPPPKRSRIDGHCFTTPTHSHMRMQEN